MSDAVAVVTGGGRGIGRTFALALAKTGAKIAVTGRTASPLDETVKLVQTAGGTAIAVTCDVADPKSVERAFGAIHNTYGRVDVLVNNAGVNGAIDELWRADPDEWWRIMEINVRGSFLCARAVLPEMTERGSGRIVNIASHAGIFRWPMSSAYSVSKCALIKFTENLAVEARRYNVAAFAYHPGLVKGGLSDHATSHPAPPDSPRGRLQAWVLKGLAEGRGVTPEQSAVGVVALASGRYDALSGRYLTVADDLDALLAKAPEIQKKDLLTLRLHE